MIAGLKEATLLTILRHKATLRFFGLAAVSLWLMAFFAPVTVTEPDKARGLTNPTHVPGYLYALWGWLGVLSLSFAWFANFPLAVSLVRLLRGKSGGVWCSTAGLVLAASSMWPHTYSDIEGDSRLVFSGLGYWLWFASFVSAWLPVLWIPRARTSN